MAAVLRDCVYGLAVGDALGVPFEFRPRGSFRCVGMVGHGTHDQPAGTFSDDTSMALALCDSVRARGGVDAADMLGRFRAWFERGEYACGGVVFDYGGTTACALRSGKGCGGEFDNGNGSLMRIAPLAFTDAGADEVRAASAVTHAHKVACDACVRFVGEMRALAAGRMPESALSERGAPVDSVRSGGYVLDTYRAAMWCLANTDCYADCVLAAVNLGGDTDTTAAVAGSLAGTLYGFDAIPGEWVEALRGKDIIEACLF